MLKSEKASTPRPEELQFSDRYGRRTAYLAGLMKLIWTARIRVIYIFSLSPLLKRGHLPLFLSVSMQEIVGLESRLKLAARKLREERLIYPPRHPPCKYFPPSWQSCVRKSGLGARLNWKQILLKVRRPLSGQDARRIKPVGESIKWPVKESISQRRVYDVTRPS